MPTGTQTLSLRRPCSAGSRHRQELDRPDQGGKHEEPDDSALQSVIGSRKGATHSGIGRNADADGDEEPARRTVAAAKMDDQEQCKEDERNPCGSDMKSPEPSQA